MRTMVCHDIRTGVAWMRRVGKLEGLMLDLPSFAVWAAEFSSKGSVRVVMVVVARLCRVLRLCLDSRLLRLRLIISLS